jgi:hypothetical protein
VDEDRAEREQAVAAASRRERAAREALEEAMGPDADEPILRAYRDRWAEASHDLIAALDELKADR